MSKYEQASSKVPEEYEYEYEVYHTCKPAARCQYGVCVVLSTCKYVEKTVIRFPSDLQKLGNLTSYHAMQHVDSALKCIQQYFPDIQS